MLLILAALASLIPPLQADDDDNRHAPPPPNVTAAPQSRIEQAAPDPSADKDDDDERHAPATEVVVTGQRLDVARARIEPSLGASTYSLNNDAIENRPGGETRNLGSILTQMPGVTSGGNGILSIRGAAGVQYRLNNVILPDGVADFGESLSARLAERTELVTGALPAQYGLASGGVVNITTKNGLYGDGGQGEFYGGSHGTVEPAIEWGGASGGSSLFASGSYRRSDIGIAPVDGSARPAHDRSRELEGFAFGDHVIDGQSRVSLIAGTSNERSQIPALAVPGIARSEARRGDFDTANHYAIVSYQRSGDGVTVQASFSGLLSSERVSPDLMLSLAAEGEAHSLHEDRRTIGTQVEAAIDAGSRHVVRAGVIGAIDRERRTEALATRAGVRESDGLIHRSTISAYVQNEWKLSPTLTANVGVRADRVSEPSGAHFGPRASLTWVSRSGLSVHSGYSRYFVAPAIGDVTLAGSSRDRVETDDYFDVGAQQKIGDFNIGIDGYWRRARNLIAERSWTSAPVGEAFNYRRGALRGVELVMTYADGPVSVWSNVALSRATARRISAGQSFFTAAQLAYVAGQDVRIDQDQRITASGGGSYRIGRLLLSGSILYGSGMRRTTADGVPNGAHLAGDAAVDLAAVYHLRLIEDMPTDLRFDIRNLFDSRVALSDGTGLTGGAPRWNEGRGLFVGIEQNF